MAVRAILGAVPSGHWMRWYCSMDRVVMGSRWTRWTTWGSRSGVSRVKKPCSAPFRRSTHRSSGCRCRWEKRSVLSRSLANRIVPMAMCPPGPGSGRRPGSSPGDTPPAPRPSPWPVGRCAPDGLRLGGCGPAPSRAPAAAGHGWPPRCWA